MGYGKIKNRIMLTLTTLLGLVSMAALPVAAQTEALGGLMCLTGAMCVLPVIIIVIDILLCIWVYKDANKRGMNGVLWLIVVLVAGIIGLIIYLIIRREHPAQ